MSQRVRLAKERFLSISKNVLLSWLTDNLKTEEEKSQFRELCSSIEALLHAQRVAQIEEIKHCYSTFDRFNRQAADEIAQTDKKELQSRQDRLLENILNILNDSNFTPVTYEDYKNALTSVYLSDLPIAVDWAKLDSYLLTDFFAKHPQLNPYGETAVPPPFHNHFVLYHCGTGVITKSKVYMDHKINLICADIQSYFKQLLRQGLLMLQGALFATDNSSELHKQGKNGPLVSKSDGSDNTSNVNGNDNNRNKEDGDYVERISLMNTYTAAKSHGVLGVLRWFLSKVTLQEPTFRHVVLVYRSLPEGVLEEKLRRAKEDSLKLSRKVRSTVKRQIKQIKGNYSHDKQDYNVSANDDNGDVNADDHDKGFDDKDKDEPEKKNEKQQQVSSVEQVKVQQQPQQQQQEQEQGQGQGQEQQAKDGQKLYNEFKRQQNAAKFQDPPTSPIANQDERYYEPICVQYYRDVPMADLETLFPCKRLSLKTFDRIYILMVIVLGMYYLLKEIFISHSGSLWHHAVLVSCAALVFRAVTWYRTQETLYHAVLNETLFHSNLACDLSALLQLIDSCNDQDLLETAIAYFALFQDRDKSTLTMPRDVDKYCEQMLKDKFGTDTDIDINDSMKKLKTLGLMEERSDITNENQSSLTVKPLREAIDCIHRHWTKFTSSFRQLPNIATTDHKLNS